MLESKNRIIFSIPVKEWLAKHLFESNTQVIDISFDISWQSNNFSDDFHSDPADKIIAATSLIRNVPLLTHDKKLQILGKKKYFPLFD